MKLLFKQRFFSWFDSYDIYDEAGNTVYIVKGQLSWGHCFKIFSATGVELGMVKQELFTFLPKFDLYFGKRYLGMVSKKFSLLPKYQIDYQGWNVDGNFLGWDYSIYDRENSVVATVSKEIFNWTDTYVIDVAEDQNALTCLMFVLAIDAEKCSRN